MDQVYINNKPDRENILPNINKDLKVKSQLSPKFNLQRQSSCKDVPEKLPKNNIKHSSSDASLSRSSNIFSRNTSRKNSFSKASRNSSVPNVSRIPTTPKAPEKLMPPPDLYVTTPEVEKNEECVPTTFDRPVGLDFNDFLPVCVV